MNMRFIVRLWMCVILILLLCETDLCLDCSVQLEPKFRQPTVARLELFPGNNAELICEVHRNLSSCNLRPGVEPRYGLQIWWCNSTDKSCYESPLPSPLPPNPPFLKMNQSKMKNASYLTSTLRLENMEESHVGQYYCVAHSEDQYTAESPGHVEVFIDIQDKSPVRITNYSQPLTDVVAGSPLTLSCSVEGYPTPKVHWEKDSKLIPGYENRTYFVKNATLDDAGIYVCIAQNDYDEVRSGDMLVKVKVIHRENDDMALTILLICGAVVCIICLLLITWRFHKMYRNDQCCQRNNISIIGDNPTMVRANHVHVIHQAPTAHRTSTCTHQERRSFLHLHDVFIHNHSADVQFAELIRSKLQERESHLNIGLWSEVERPDRSSSRCKLLRLRLLNCSRIVIITSEDYLKHTYHSFTSAVVKSRVSSESIRRKLIVVRVLEEDKIPRSLTQDIMASLDYNVETDSCYFWPRFMSVAVPEQSEILYWA